MTKEQLLSFSKHPTRLGAPEQAILAEELAKYPYSNLLQVLYTASCPKAEADKRLSIAAAYTSEMVLQRAMHYSWEETQEETTVSTPKTDVVSSPDPAEPIIEEASPVVTETIETTSEVIFATPVSIEEKAIATEAKPSIESSNTTAFSPAFSLDMGSDIESGSAEEIVDEPESFTEWLRKTREAKEAKAHHSPIKLASGEQIITGTPDQLEKLYLENMYQLQIIEDKKREQSPADLIIEKFIQEDPHIKPIQENSPITENKARKSTELPDELITETLAQIYIGQKLYSKAVLAYEKLSLKFPKKSAYFASLIQKLKSDNQLT